MARHLLPGFRVCLAKRARSGHWQGGPAYHDGAVCPVCDRPFLLLWDFKCSDPKFRVDGRSRFKSLERLPLYYCWTCCAEMDYRVVGPNRLEVIRHQGKIQGEDFPYKNFPLEFDRRPLELERLKNVPMRIQKAVNDSSGELRISASARKVLSKWLGRRVKFGFDIWWQQFGGRPWLAQGMERIVCPNQECSWSRRGWSVLAAIVNDPPSGLPMIESLQDVKKNKGSFNHYVQVVFHICRGCLTVHTANRCD